MVASKLKKCQKQKRWDGSGLVVPESYISKVLALAGEPADGLTAAASPQLRQFAAALLKLLQLGSTYAEMDALKPVCRLAVQLGAAAAAAASPQQQQHAAAEQQRAQELLVELLLLPNSRPLHKQLLSGLRPLLEEQQRGQRAGGASFAQLAAARIQQLAQAELDSGGGGGSGGHSTALLLGSALASLLAHPACKPALAPCAAPAVAALAGGVRAALQAAEGGEAGGQPGGDGAGVDAATMEGVQDSVSAMYYLLSLHGGAMLAEQPAAGASAVVAAGDALLCALSGRALVREALASAAVALAAAAALPAAPPAALARCLAEGLLLVPGGAEGGDDAADSSPGQPVALLLLLPEEAQGGAESGTAGSTAPPAGHAPLGLLDCQLRQRGMGGLAAELRRLPPISRLCALRGLISSLPPAVLCAPLRVAPSPGPGLGADADAARPWLLLVDGALPAIAAAIRGTSDEHFRFHAHSTLAACLERLRSLQQQAEGGGKAPGPGPAAAGRAAAGGVAPPALDAAAQRLVLRLLWQGFESQLSQTLGRVVAAFDCLLDVLRWQQRQASEQQQQGQQGQVAGHGAAGGGDVLLRIAADLLAVDPSRKGRYAALAALVPRVGAAPLLALAPDLVPSCLEAAGQQLISAAASTFLLALLAQLQQEQQLQPESDGTSSSISSADGDAAGGWRAAWAPHLAAALLRGSEAAREALATHLLPRLLAQDPAALPLLLRPLLPGGGGGGGGGPTPSSDDDGVAAAAALLALLKAARRQQLLEDLDALAPDGLPPHAVRAALLAAVRSGSEGLRVDALALVCCHPRTTAPPSQLELGVAAEAVRLTLRCPGSSLRHKTLATLLKLLMRQRAAVGAALARRHPQRDSQAAAEDAEAVEAQQRWLRWLGATLLASLYPGATHERSFVALELLALLLEAFGDLLSPAAAPPPWARSMAVIRRDCFDPFGPSFCSPGTVQLLLGAALDSWERLREAAAAVLLRLPAPLPGLGSPAALRPLLARALRLLGCPRGREADAGAQLLALLLRKYGGGGGGLCWHFDIARGTVEQAPVVPAPQAGLATSSDAASAAAAGEAGGGPGEEEQAAALWCCLSSAADLLQRRVELAAADLLEACRGGLALGVLLALRYAVPLVPWRRLAEAGGEGGGAAARDWRGLVSRLLALTYAVSDITLPILSKPQDQNTDAADVDADEVELLGEDGGALPPSTGGGGGGGDALGPSAQVLNTGAWQSAKEAGLLLGALARALPIEGPSALLDAGQLSDMARRFTVLLCQLKHNGAVDKTQQGFAALCEQLLAAGDPALRTLPRACLASFLAFMRRPDQGQADIVRRSAGLPFGVAAIFYAEPDGGRKALLHEGMAELLATAGGDAEQHADHSWPRVHALNCLRSVFQDADLAVEASAHLAPGLQAAVLGMGAPQWEVRNAASLCYTALLVRLLGFRNAAGKGTVAAKRAPTAADFFARHPSLHPFLLRQLAHAAAALVDDGGGGGGGGGGAAMHPSLFPVLVLLSRLRPSQLSRLSGSSGSSGLAEERLAPAAFVPPLQRCAAAPPLAVRRLAAAALPPLLPPEAQPGAAAALADSVVAGFAAAAAAARFSSKHALAAAAAGDDGDAPPPGRPSFNALHGCLLQLRALLEAAAAGGDAAACEALLAAAARPLNDVALPACFLVYRCGTARGGLEKLSVVPAAVSLEYLRVAAAAAAALRAARAPRPAGAPPPALAVLAAADRWLTVVQGLCWTAIRRTTDGGAAPPDHVSPAASLAFKHAAQLFFSQLLGAQQRAATAAALHPSRSSDSVASGGGGGGGGGELLVFRLETALQSPLAEVRCAALKVVGRAAAAGQLSAPGLRPLLWAQLGREGCAKGRRRLLALLALLPPGGAAATPACSSDDDEDACASAGQAAPAAWEAEFFAVLRHAGGDGGDAATRRHAVRCLGPLAAAALRASGGLPGGGGAAAAQAADALLALARRCAAPAQLPELRLAAAEALAASGLLALQPCQSDAAAEAAAAAWEALLQLVEDDDEEVRGAATAAAAAALATPGWAPAAAAEAEAEAGCEPAAPCEERLLRRVLPALAARFGPHPALLSLLRRLCWAGGEGGEGAAAARGGGCAAAAEKLFDREPDNMHEEPLLLAQLAAGCLAGLLPSLPPDSPAAHAMRGWAAAAAWRLAQLAPALRSPRAGEGPAAAEVLPPHQQRFVELSRGWLALWAAAHLPQDAASAPWDRSAAAAALALADGAAGPAAAAASAPQLVGVASAAAAAWQRREAGGPPGGASTEQVLFLV